ncbi:hypothetical protein FB451DRAFT_1557170 [Mycena latifolia]|nr:hypothetical protein FB451DRAFT_1557170 [Mycena latifolia]
MPINHGPDPEDSVLVAAFTKYARENSGAGLSTKDQLARLKHDFDLTIGKTKLYALRKRLGIESVKNSAGKRTEEETRQTVIDLKQSDVAGGWGVTQTKGRLANVGVLIPRDSLREILHNEFDAEFESRFVGKKKPQKHRTPLKALGPWHQEHSDGHEKLSEQGLDIGIGIHLPIYASKDQWSSFLHALLLMPNVRTGNAIAHYYLDLVEARNFTISMQLTTDQGSEVNEMHKIHEQLRDEVAPELHHEKRELPNAISAAHLCSHHRRSPESPAFGDVVPPEYPHGVKQSSTNNTPIESLWRWLRDGDGHSTKLVLQEGAATGIFLPNDEIHRQTFYWLFVPLIQEGLDNFREYWNAHTLQKSKGKKNAYGSEGKLVTVLLVSILKLSDASAKPTVAEADGVYVDLGSPQIILPTAWVVFQQVVAELQRRALAS